MRRVILACARMSRATFGLGFASLVLSALALLPIHTARAGGGRALHLVLVDVSASVVATRPAYTLDALRVVREVSAEARGARRDIGLIVLGAGARVAIEPTTADELEARLRERMGTALDPDRLFLADGLSTGEQSTDLAGALSLCSMLCAGRSSTRVHLVGDGSWNGRDPAPFAAELAARGVAFEELRVGPATRANTGIAALRAALRVERGAPIGLECDLVRTAAQPAATVELEIAWTTPSSTRATRRVTCAPPPGLVPDAAGLQRWTARLDVPDLFAPTDAGGLVAIEAQLARSSAQTDADPRDDRASAFTRVGEDLVVGVYGSPGLLALLRRAPVQGLAWHALTEDSRDGAPGGAPGSSAAAPALDALVSHVLPPRARVESVLARGGGWLDLVSERDLTARLAPAARAGAATVAALAPAPLDGGPRDLVYLVDASGSMEGAPFAAVRAALARIVESAPAEDELEARFFAASLGPPVRLGRGDERHNRVTRANALAELFAARTPSGGTGLWTALEALAAERERSSHPALVFVLTDGRDQDRADLVRRGSALRARFAAARARLVVVSAGTDPDEELLRAVCARSDPDASDLLRAGDLSDPRAAERLASLFEHEVLRERLLDTASVSAVRNPGALAAEFAHLLVDPARVGALAIGRHVRSVVAHDAQVAWVDENGAALLAVNRVGRGIVASTAVDPIGMLERTRPDLAELLVPLVRALARGASRSEARARRAEDAIVLEDLDEHWPIRFTGYLLLESGRRIALDFLPDGSGPGALARRRAALPRSASDVVNDAHARLEFEVGGGALSAELPGLEIVPSAPPELSQAARRFEVPPNSDRAPGEQRGAHACAPYFLLAALLFLGLSGWGRVAERSGPRAA